MVVHRKRSFIALILLLLLFIAGCGPPIPGLTAPTPVATGDGPVQPTGQTPTQAPTPQPDTRPTGTTDPTEAPSPTETNSETATPTETPSKTETATTTTPPVIVEVAPIECTPGAPAASQPQASTTAPAQSPTDVAPAKPDFAVVAPQKCTVALGNPSDTFDCLFVPVDLGVQSSDIASVTVRLTSKTLATEAGLSVDENMMTSPEPKVTELRVKVRPADWGQTHELTITADPEKIIEEADENNNSVAVKVALPSRDNVDPNRTCPESTPVPEGGSSGPTSPDVPTDSAPTQR